MYYISMDINDIPLFTARMYIYIYIYIYAEVYFAIFMWLNLKILGIVMSSMAVAASFSA